MTDKDIYTGKSEGRFISPFSFTIDPMRQLILIPFEKDPDTLYNQFEVQQSVLSDESCKIAVIAYKINGSADVYYQKGYPLASQSSILNDPAFVETQFNEASFAFNPDDLDLLISFKDVRDRNIRLAVKERARKGKEPFTLLAPVGVISKKPLSMPVYYMHQMSFARKRHTDIVISIGEKSHKPDGFFLPIEKSRNYFTRYALDTFNVDVNPARNGPIQTYEIGQDKHLETNGIYYELNRSNGYPEIMKISVRREQHICAVTFSPSFPDLLTLKNGTFLTGDFCIASDDESGAGADVDAGATGGAICGTYQIEKEQDEVSIKLHPGAGWIHNEKRLIIRFMFKVVKLFRDWPKSYSWDAKITHNEKGGYFMDSSWKNVS